MLRLFFHRESRFVTFNLWFCTFCLFYLFIFTSSLSFHSFTYQVFLFSFLLQVAFARGVELYPWYPKNAPGIGIRLQFQKALVLVSYFWLLQTISLIFFPSFTILLILDFLLLPITISACILIFFHFKDPDPSRPNILTGNSH